MKYILIILLILSMACSDDNPFQPEADLDNGDEQVEPDTEFEQHGEPFEKVPAVSDVAMYEVNPLVFSPSKNLNGITENLERIKELGINTVWLMPIHPIGQERAVGSPYAVRDYRAVNPEYGTLEDLRALVEKAHSLNMAVMMDWVANHTAWDHKWIDSNPEFYVKDDEGNIIHPPGTNFTDVAELNYNSGEMRQEMIESMKFWVLEANIDGFRCDFATAVPNDFWNQAINELRAIPDRQLLMFAESDDKLLLNTGFDMIFGWPFYGTLLNVFDGGSANSIYTGHLQEFDGLKEDEEVVRWITNHDQHAWDGSPLEILGGKQSAISAFVAATYTGGVPLVYNGQEVGVTTTIPFFAGTDFTIDWDRGNAVRSEYSAILNYRAETKALRSGRFQSILSDPAVAGFIRYTDTDTVFTLINTEASEQSLTLPDMLKNSRFNDVISNRPLELQEELQIGAHEYLILNRN